MYSHVDGEAVRGVWNDNPICWTIATRNCKNQKRFMDLHSLQIIKERL
jgi:hypothetical protein